MHIKRLYCGLALLRSVLSAEENARLGNDVIYDGGFHPGQELLKALPCPDYTKYAKQHHEPISEGPLKLPFQRPHQTCRKFSAPEVEQVIEDLYTSLEDRDLAQIFRNAFPNTLDTTVSWHVDGIKTHAPASKYKRYRDNAEWTGAQSFIVTGDINAEWLRDSTNQLAQYQALAPSSPAISNLLKGAIATQAEFVITSPYCNAFQPPDPSGLKPAQNGQSDTVHPIYEPSDVFECKYELDSLANFLSLANQYYESTGSFEHLTNRWFLALRTVLLVLDAQSQPTFDDTSAKFLLNQYTFRRWTDTGTETLNLQGIGNPIANGTGLIRSAFRPSDDATILPFLIPANAMMSVELSRTAKMLKGFLKGLTDAQDRENVQAYIDLVSNYATSIHDGVLEHGVVNHAKYGKVLAYETDGYGSHILMDDANIPSLLSLPKLGFMDRSDPLYQSTRKMILSKDNPYFLSGQAFSGIGGPHIGVRNAWPMSALMQAMTSGDDQEILDCLERVKKVSVFGLINESVDVQTGVDSKTGAGMTRSWFAWANSVFAQCILWLAAEKPHLVFASGHQRYTVENGFEPVKPA